MIINNKIIEKMLAMDLTLSIRPVREMPNCIRISVRNDKYVYSHFVYKDLYNVEGTAILEFIIDKFKREVSDL